MRRAERIVDVDIAQLGELRGEGRIVLLFFSVEAQIFEQDDVAG